jgi:hypothetical protein
MIRMHRRQVMGAVLFFENSIGGIYDWKEWIFEAVTAMYSLESNTCSMQVCINRERGTIFSIVKHFNL